MLITNHSWMQASSGYEDMCSEQGIPTMITWSYGGKEVAVEGSWDNWKIRFGGSCAFLFILFLILICALWTESNLKPLDPVNQKTLAEIRERVHHYESAPLRCLSVQIYCWWTMEVHSRHAMGPGWCRQCLQHFGLAGRHSYFLFPDLWMLL